MMPGWFRDSWGYHGDGGRFFLKSGSPEEPPVVCRLKYGIGDTVGCGVDEEGNLFFTRNGEHLGKLASNWDFLSVSICIH